MAGNKNSGRKTRYEEIQGVKLLDICTDWLVKNFDSFTKDEKLKVVLTIAPKAISDKHEHSGLSSQMLTVVHNYVPADARIASSRDKDQIQPETDSRLEQIS